MKSFCTTLALVARRRLNATSTLRKGARYRARFWRHESETFSAAETFERCSGNKTVLLFYLSRERDERVRSFEAGKSKTKNPILRLVSVGTPLQSP
jgi:hypothetical protein